MYVLPTSLQFSRQPCANSLCQTQYGNILRLRPTTESPLLLPANTHKQLVVIDFEYASANTRGLEFANHFTEWCYNYHDPARPHGCNTKVYPTPEEQRTFIRAYLNHRPQFTASASATPKTMPSAGPSGAGISAFMLDSRTPTGASNYQEEEERRVKEVEKQVEMLMAETRLWRIANSAQWVAWGIVQYNIPELDAFDAASAVTDSSSPGGPSGIPVPGKMSRSNSPKHVGVAESAVTAQVEEDTVEDDDEFDYLGYAQERAMFFWGDCVGLGLVRLEELPERVQKEIKVVGY